jgi:preprotein translocase subunit SecG
MQNVFFVLILLVAVLLILVVLIQNAKGGGIASNVGISSQMMGGVKRQVDFIEKATWYLAGALAVLSIATGVFFKHEAGPATGVQTEEAANLDFSVPSNPNLPQPEEQ